MPRLNDEKGIKVRKTIAFIVLKDKPKEAFLPNGNPSSSKIAVLLKERGLGNISRQTIAKILKEDLEEYINMHKSFVNSDEVQQYIEMMDSAKEIWNNKETDGKTRSTAYQAWLKAKKQKEQLEEVLNNQAIAKTEAKRPNYLLRIEPKTALRKCPKCGNEFYDNIDINSKKDEESKKDDKNVEQK